MLYARWALHYMRIVNEYVYGWYTEGRASRSYRIDGGGEGSVLYASALRVCAHACLFAICNF